MMSVFPEREMTLLSIKNAVIEPPFVAQDMREQSRRGGSMKDKSDLD